MGEERQEETLRQIRVVYLDDGERGVRRMRESTTGLTDETDLDAVYRGHYLRILDHASENPKGARVERQRWRSTRVRTEGRPQTL